MTNISIRSMRWSQLVLILFVFVALSGSLFVNDGKFAIIPYSVKTLDKHNANYVSPFAEQKIKGLYYRHWLGTDAIGRDVLAGIINGTKVAFWVGLLSIGLALLIGIPAGLFSGYYGNDFKLGRIEFVLVLVSFFLTLYYWCYFFNGSMLFFVLHLLAFGIYKGFIFFIFEKFYPNRKRWNIPVDDIMTKIIEIFKSIPTLIILILLLGVFNSGGIITISICLGLLFWINIARYVRAEVISMKSSELITAQKALGNSDLGIMFTHCITKALPPVMVSAIFLFAATIAMESTLSFFGLGMPLDQVTWGSLLNESRKYLGAWWMAVFPGACLFFVLLALAKESDYWTKRMMIK